ncbi:MAG: lactonase family protein [Lachnospiraceae bacterium]|nr:lactonase family protein [Lachnospiraceae bacterium]
MGQNREAFLYMGSWEHDYSGEELGIQSYRFLDGKIEKAGKPAAAADACVGAMYYDAKRNVLYCVDETESSASGGGRVFAFQVDGETGALTLLSEVSAYGTRTSGLATDESGKYLLVTNHGGKRFVMRSVRGEDGVYRFRREYDETNVVLYALEENGAIGKVKDIVGHSGCGTLNPDIQAHPHCVRRSPLYNLFCVCDKGADAVYMYRIDYGQEKLVLCEGSPYCTGRGSAPRYCVFHPREKLFVINYEGMNRLSVFHYEENGKMEPIFTTDVIPENQEYTFKGGKRGVVSSDLMLHPDGVHLYNITRGLNQIDVYCLNADTGELIHGQTLELPMEKGGIDTIRSFALSPDLKYMLTGAMKEDRVIVLSVDEHGHLSYAGKDAEVEMYHPAPILFVPE